MKYLIAGLGNIGDQYKDTRHNIGFTILDTLAEASNTVFADKRYGFVGEFKYKARTYLLLKPSTFVNLSGKAVNYWLRKGKIPVENLLVVVDDISLPFGTLRIRPGGGDAGHNGLLNISQVFGHQNYTRLRFGIGKEFKPDRQVDYVLGEWSENEQALLPDRVALAMDAIKSFGTIGVERTMNLYNNK
ncbi:MAG: aminoacyl-tRNA hydrolase [Bacteroidales bacterium]|nr:MAG: aminoacyl-tRNA hydrolase [Bacteroidales bacterium]